MYGVGRIFLWNIMCYECGNRLNFYAIKNTYIMFVEKSKIIVLDFSSSVIIFSTNDIFWFPSLENPFFSSSKDGILRTCSAKSLSWELRRTRSSTHVEETAYPYSMPSEISEHVVDISLLFFSSFNSFEDTFTDWILVSISFLLGNVVWETLRISTYVVVSLVV